MEKYEDESQVHEIETQVIEDTETSEDAEGDERAEITRQEVEELRKRASQSSQNYERAKKLEKELEQLKKNPPTETQSVGEGNLSPKDYLALTEHKVPAKDYDEVVRVAKIVGKPIAEALEDSVVQTILRTRAEERKTASATNTGGGSRVASVKPETLIRKASSGELPESDDEISRLAEARMSQRLKEKD